MIARLARQLELAVSTVDLTISQYRLLGLLVDGREAASALADKLAVSRPSITGVVDGLVARGLVVRQHGESDRRRIGVEATAEGRNVLAIADAEIERRLEAIVAALGASAGLEALAGLRHWHHALEAHRTEHCARAVAAATDDAARMARSTTAAATPAAAASVAAGR